MSVFTSISALVLGPPWVDLDDRHTITLFRASAITIIIIILAFPTAAAAFYPQRWIISPRPQERHQVAQLLFLPHARPRHLDTALAPACKRRGEARELLDGAPGQTDRLVALVDDLDVGGGRGAARDPMDVAGRVAGVEFIAAQAGRRGEEGGAFGVVPGGGRVEGDDGDGGGAVG